MWILRLTACSQPAGSEPRAQRVCVWPCLAKPASTVAEGPVVPLSATAHLPHHKRERKQKAAGKFTRDLANSWISDALELF